MCYVPFIDLANRFVPFPSLPENSTPLIAHTGINTTLEIILVVALVLYHAQAAVPCGSRPPT